MIKKKLLICAMIALCFTGCGNSIVENNTESTIANSNIETVEPQNIPEEIAVDKAEDILSNDIIEQLEKLSILAESASGKATLYYDRTGYEEANRASWHADIYLLYNNTLEKLPDVAFSQYNEEEVEVECKDFDGDGKDEVAIVTVNCGSGMYESDIRFIENPGTDMHFVVYTDRIRREKDGQKVDVTRLISARLATEFEGCLLW